MKILLVAATELEIEPFLNKLSYPDKTSDYHKRYRVGNASVDVLVTGVGMMVTAYRLGQRFATEKYDYAINAGICGSFTRSFRIGDVVEITEDCVSELGAEDRDRFLTIFDLGLIDPENPPYMKGKLVNSLPIRSQILERLHKVKGITVNTVHGNSATISRIKELFDPQTESMEGAAFLYGCLLEKIPNIQIRAISNYVEERNRSRWNLDLALKNLNKSLLELIKEIAV